MEEKEKKKGRFWELDFVRGVCVILMIIDHAMFSLISAPYIAEFFGKIKFGQIAAFSKEYWANPMRLYAQEAVTTAFFLICGISCTLSRSNFKRGLKALGVAGLITLGTFVVSQIFSMNDTIIFGVIHMLACSMLLYALFNAAGRLISRIPGKASDWIGRLLPATIGVILLAVYYAFFTEPVMENGFFSLQCNVYGGHPLESIFMNIKNSGFYSADYYPMLPYCAVVLVGSGIGELLYNTRAKNYLSSFDGKWNKPVCFMGRHALLAYILHQPLIWGIIALICVIF